MKRVLLAAVIAVGCWRGSAPDEPTPTTGSAKPEPPPMTPSTPIELLIVEGTPMRLPDGTTVDVKDVGYAHLADSQNLSNATFVVSRGDETADVGLAYHHGGSVNKARTKTALGWKFTLEMADPYAKPSRAKVTVLKVAR